MTSMLGMEENASFNGGFSRRNWNKMEIEKRGNEFSIFLISIMVIINLYKLDQCVISKTLGLQYQLSLHLLTNPNFILTLIKQ